MISPEPFTRVQGDVLIAVAFNQAVKLIDPSQIRIKLNGKDITQRLNITEELAIGVITGVKQGRARVDVDYLGSGKREQLASFSFDAAPATATSGTRRERTMEVSGDFATEGRTQKISGDQQNIARQRANLRYRYKGFSVIGNTMLTSEENRILQPQHRFTIDMGWRGFRIRGGDIRPRYNNLMLNGKRVRGAELYMGGKYLGVSAIYGQASRAIEGEELLTFIDATDSTAAEIDTSYNYGTWERTLAAARLRFGNPDRFSFGITAMKVKDDTSSIAIGDKPKDNLVAGLDLSAYFDRRRFQLTGEVALSLTSDDIRAKPFEDLADFADIIVVNQYFDPLPNTGIGTSETDSTQTDFNVNEVVGSIIDNALSYKTRLRLRYLRNDIQVGYRLISRGFRSLGNPTLLNDQNGYYVRDRIRLIGNNVYLNGGYENYFDNVTGRGDIRNTRERINGGISIYTDPALPDINFGYSSFLNSSDGTLDSTIVTEADTANGIPAIYKVSDQRSNVETIGYNFSLTQSASAFTGEHTLILSVQSTNRSDIFNDFGNNDISAFSASIRTMWDYPLMTRVTFSNSKLSGLGGLTDLTYDQFVVRGDLFLMNRRLVPWFGPRITISSGYNGLVYIDPADSIDPNDYTLPANYDAAVAKARASTKRKVIADWTKIDWLGGFRWNFTRNQTLEGTFSLTQYLDNSMYEYWNGDQAKVSEVDDVNRNNLIGIITYQMRF